MTPNPTHQELVEALEATGRLRESHHQGSNNQFRAVPEDLLKAAITALQVEVEPIWTGEQVEKLNEWQRAGYVHEFTCGNDHPQPRTLIATRRGWVCPSCDYTRDWAHAAMFQGAPPNPLAALKSPPPDGGAVQSVAGEDELHSLLTAAYEAGCQDAHFNYQPEPEPEFGEAAWDYASSICSKRRWAKAPSPADSGQEVERLREALEPFATAYDVNASDGPCLTEEDVRAMYNAVGIQEYRRASQAYAALRGEQGVEGVTLDLRLDAETIAKIKRQSEPGGDIGRTLVGSAPPHQQPTASEGEKNDG
jgi:hypothetical protein